MKLQFRAAWMLQWFSWSCTDCLTALAERCLTEKPLHHLQIKIKMNYETSRGAVTRQETDYQVRLTRPPSSALQMRNGGCKREIQNWCEFHKSVSGSAMINDSVRIEGTYRLAFRCFITSTCKSHQAQSVKPTGNSQQLHHSGRTCQGWGGGVSAWGVMHKRATFAREWSHELTDFSWHLRHGCHRIANNVRTRAEIMPCHTPLPLFLPPLPACLLCPV